MELDKTIKKRKSVRNFKNKKPDWRDIIECVDAARYAPMAGGRYTLKFIIIDDEKAIEKLAEAAQQEFIKEVCYIIIVCSNPGRTIRDFGKRGEIYVRQQAGATIQNVLLKIEEKGLSTCWVGHFVDEQVKRILGIPDNVQIEALLPVGYEFRKTKSKKEIDIDNILYFYKYQNKKMKKIPKMDV
ncbi:nitroreductase [Candidatus Pacearchaeota archaeon]|nr:nitroreductase [Candidatus Pacearchaeota archaeon]|tara:strand:- start:507 stop:1061 length:555 start_codon:yes stop_codon:yes gene_type:complete